MEQGIDVSSEEIVYNLLTNSNQDFVNDYNLTDLEKNVLYTTFYNIKQNIEGISQLALTFVNEINLKSALGLWDKIKKAIRHVTTTVCIY
ncbi:MAG: hypothetical protein ACOCXH_07335 [Cyclobacteriaceae bacterium]